MRAFGNADYLDLDFAQADRPELVTRLLALCDEDGDTARWWSHTVSARIAALLRLVAVTDDCKHLQLNARCMAPGCGELYAFDLPLPALATAHERDTPIETRLAADRPVRLRRPTGNDLRAWRAAQPASTAAARRMMIASLVIEGVATADDEALLSAALSQGDPLVDFSVSCVCPACGAGNEVSVDLETLALNRLAARQRLLLDEVHCLASVYGWTEREVLSIPPARRARYRALIEAAR